MHTVEKIFIVLVMVLVICGGSYCAQEPVMEAEGKAYQMSARELAIWNDPEFQRQFIESYIAETDIEPRVTIDERDKMEEILELISSDQMDEAARALSKERGDAVSAVYDFTLANIYFQQDKLDQAAAAYRVAVEKFPKFRRAWKNLSLIYVRLNKFDKAVPALTRVIQLGGADAITYGLLGFSYSALENPLAAGTAYSQAILLDPETLDWKKGLARSFFQQQRYAEAVALCDQLINDYPDQAELWLLQANAFIGLEKPMKAAEIFELVDQLGQSTADSQFLLGDIYINEKLYDLAADSYIRGMEKEPEESIDRAVRSAKILSSRGAFEQTHTMISKINSMYGSRIPDEDRKELLKIEARLAVAEGKAEDEVRVLEQIVEIDPLDGEALLLLGQYYGRNDQPEKAIFYFQRAASLEDFEADAKVRHAQLLVNQGKYADAVPLLKSAQQLNPRDNIQQYLEQVERIAKNR